MTRSPLYGACGGDAASLLKTREAAAQFLERLREKYPNGGEEQGEEAEFSWDRGAYHFARRR